MNLFESKLFMCMPVWKSVMGLQFENLVVNNLKSLCKILRIDLLEVVTAGPFFQRATQRQKGCQIDLMIQSKHNCSLHMRNKIPRSEIKSFVIEEMEKKINSLSTPRGFSIRPVLIRVNGAYQVVMKSEIFNDIVNFSQFFN